jgi:hypothetical protein
VNNAVSDCEFGVCFAGDAISAAGHDVIKIPESGPKIGMAKTSPLLTSTFPFASHGSPVIAHSVELIRAA